MSIVFVDGFDHYESLSQKWDFISAINNSFVGNATAILGTGGRNGGGCAFTQTASNIGASLIGKNFANNATMICGWAGFIDDTSNSNDEIIAFWMDGGTVQVDLRVTQSGHLYFTRAGTVLGSQSTNAITMRAWHYFEMKVTINNTTGVAILNVDGTNTGWLNLTAQNTRNTTLNQTNQIRLGVSGSTSGGSAGINHYIDDFYLMDTAGSLNSFLGDVKVTGVLPTGNGTSTQYTLNAAVWPSSTEVYIGQVIIDSNSNLQVVTAVTSDAKTGGSHPTWATGVGATTTDNHVTWICLGADTYWLEVAQNPPEGSIFWQQGFSYNFGNAVWDSNNNLQIITAVGSAGRGQTSSAEPSWNTSVGGTTFDGGAGPTLTMTWTNLGPGLGTFLSDATVGHITRFTFPAVPATSVSAVSVTMRAGKSDASTRSVRGATLSSGTAGDSGTDLVLSTSYQFVEGIFENDPHTGSPWTPTAVNAAEFGVKTTA